MKLVAALSPALLLLPGCYTLDDYRVAPEDVDIAPADETPEEPEVDDDDASEDPPEVEQDVARIVEAELPTALACGESFEAAITVRNEGSADWTREAGFKLGALDDSDPLYEDGVRVWLEDDDLVTPGDEHTFEFTLTAPDEAGVYRTDWRMVHEGVRWFGPSAASDVAVACPGLPPLDLGAVDWLHADVSGWTQTATLASVSVSGGTICLDYDHANVWPIDVIGDGVEVVGNPWIFIYEDDRWYGATWEWLRPGQTCKNASSVAGDHIKRAPFDAASGWTPTSGTTYWFMVSGLARASERNALERTNVVEFVWP